MTPTLYQRSILALAGLIAAGIGLAITFLPHAFYASYDIVLGTDSNLLNELRAPGANLAALGFLMLGGAVRARWFSTARLVAMTVFFAFAFGRVVGWLMDGSPNTSIQIALGLEIVIGALAFFASRRSAMPRGTRQAV